MKINLLAEKIEKENLEFLKAKEELKKRFINLKSSEECEPWFYDLINFCLDHKEKRQMKNN